MSSLSPFIPSSNHPYSHLRGSAPCNMQNMPQLPLQLSTTNSLYGQPHFISSSECEDCSTKCTEPMCSTANQLTSQCTDKCVVIACNDPEHDNLNCFDGHTDCNFACNNSADCVDCDGFHGFLQCCNGNHPCNLVQAQSVDFSHQPHPQHMAEHSSWSSSLSGALCNGHHQVRQLEDIRPPAALTTFSPIPTPSVFRSAANGTNHRNSSSISSHQSSSSVDVFAPAASSPSFPPIVQSQVHIPQTAQYDALQYRQPENSLSSIPSSSSQPTLTCMWGDCQACFTSLVELVGHVNLAHLRIATCSDHPTNTSSETQVQIQHPEDTARLPCLWGNCNENLRPELLAGTSSSSAEDIMLSSLASHLFQDHLGLHNSDPDIDRMLAEMTTTRQQMQGRDGQDPQYKARFDVPSGNATGISVPIHNSQVPPQDTYTPITPISYASSSVVSSPVASVSEIPSGEVHLCRWKGCGLPFETCDDLTTHMTAVHVGSGKAQYDCLWEGCTRNGDKGFSSKQKICRHLQSHTGYRPFQCSECLQNFSEAATLQQHMRRHTQEKPYKCDFPGCGKSFAITGALTIHKRIHNGQKPFKCSYCGRGFTESSNLSKHLRTHTGERPYVCAEPGCGKAFARPDQLNRHTAVHKKKVPTATAAEV